MLMMYWYYVIIAMLAQDYERNDDLYNVYADQGETRREKDAVG